MAVVKRVIGNVKGPQGIQGPQGPQGLQGIKGNTGVRGSRWVNGVAITGNSTTPTTYATGIADALVNDQYLNTKTGNLYRCTEAGDETTAKWVFEGNISNNVILMFNSYDIASYNETVNEHPAYVTNVACVDGSIVALSDATGFYSSQLSPTLEFGSWIDGAFGMGMFFGISYDIDSGISVVVGDRGSTGTLEHKNFIYWKDLKNPILDPDSGHELWIQEFINSEENVALFDVCCAEGRFVAVGESSYIITATIDEIKNRTSQWDIVSNVNQVDGHNLRKIVYGDGSWVVLGDLGFPYTKNAEATGWTRAEGVDDPSSYKDIAFGNGTFVAVGNGSKILYSKNASNWTGLELSDDSSLGILNTDTISSITFIKDDGTNRYSLVNRFIACTESGSFISSFDGINWKPIVINGGNITDGGYRIKLLYAPETDEFRMMAVLEYLTEDESEIKTKFVIFEENVDSLDTTDIVLLLYKDYLERT